MRRLIFVVAAVVLLLGINANATPITFVETGTANGRYHGTFFSDLPFVLTATGDTSQSEPWNEPWLGDHRGWVIVCSMASVKIGDFAPITYGSGQTRIRVLNDTRTMSFGINHPDVAPFLHMESDFFRTWDLTTSIGPITAPDSGGSSYMGFDSNLWTDGLMTFTATVGDAPEAIPEPGTATLFCGGGFVALACYLRRMRKA